MWSRNASCENRHIIEQGIARITGGDATRILETTHFVAGGSLSSSAEVIVRETATSSQTPEYVSSIKTIHCPPQPFLTPQLLGSAMQHCPRLVSDRRATLPRVFFAPWYIFHQLPHTRGLNTTL